MGAINCSECGKLCMETPNKLCASCLTEYLEDEIKVAEYLRVNENSTVDEVHQATKVKKHIVMKMIREGRVIEGKLAFPCETCGVAISSGRWCKSCSDKVMETKLPTQDENKENNEYRGMYSARELKPKS